MSCFVKVMLGDSWFVPRRSFLLLMLSSLCSIISLSFIRKDSWHISVHKVAAFVGYMTLK